MQKKYIKSNCLNRKNKYLENMSMQKEWKNQFVFVVHDVEEKFCLK